jgi:predicted metal-binding membrane protein
MFFSVSGLIFAASAVMTIVWCASMSSMGGMTMPGGWTMTMTWMRMPGQTGTGAAASFLGMWMAMMIAMMLPSLIPMLMRYRQTVVATNATNATNAASATSATSAAASPRLGLLTTIAGSAYFFVWALFGMAVYPLGIAFAEIAMQEPAVSRAVPIAAGTAILIAGLLQFTAWKARYLERCRQTPVPGRAMRADAVTAWRHGLRLGLHCTYACAGPMMILLVLGVMDLRVMAVVTAAITLERFAPAGLLVARAIGAVVVATGLFLTIQNLADLI